MAEGGARDQHHVRFVRFEHAADFLLLGWVPCPLPPAARFAVHDHYGIMMWRRCCCRADRDPPEPPDARPAARGGAVAADEPGGAAIAPLEDSARQRPTLDFGAGVALAEAAEVEPGR